jgi:hypothetical protein
MMIVLKKKTGMQFWLTTEQVSHIEWHPEQGRMAFHCGTHVVVADLDKEPFKMNQELLRQIAEGERPQPKCFTIDVNVLGMTMMPIAIQAQAPGGGGIVMPGNIRGH